jgi:hypothetical protein
MSSKFIFTFSPEVIFRLYILKRLEKQGLMQENISDNFLPKEMLNVNVL